MTDKEIKRIWESIYGQNIKLTKENIKLIKRIKGMPKTNGEVFKLLTDLRLELSNKIDKVDTKVDGVSTQVATMQGRQNLSTSLISVAFGVFTFIITLATGGRR